MAIVWVSGLLVLPFIADAQLVTVIKQSDQSVQANFATFDPSGCFETDVVVLGTLGRTQQLPGGGTVSASFASLNIMVINAYVSLALPLRLDILKNERNQCCGAFGVYFF